MMRVHVYCDLFNERVLAPYFLRHYGSFAERIFIWDDDSTDGTREILAAHPKVTLLPHRAHGCKDDYRVEELFPQYIQYSRGQADWCMCVDADEFVYHPNILAALERQYLAGVQLIYCRGYVMLSARLPETTGQLYEEVNRGVPDRWSCKWCVFSPSIDVKFRSGRHGAPAYVTPGAIHLPHNQFKLLHFRYFGWEYYRARDARNYARIEAGGNRPRKHSWRNLPDDTQGEPQAWYAQALARAEVVV